MDDFPDGRMAYKSFEKRELRFAVSFIIYKDDSLTEFLAIKRPYADKELGGLWGLPATSFNPTKESLEDAIIRGGKEKLNCGIIPVRRLPFTMIQAREGYDLLLIDYECKLANGNPNVAKATTTGTRYIAQAWSRDPQILIEAAKKGSVCTQLFLFDKGLLRKDELVTELPLSHN